ncbi:uncharacterized protein [Lolium perenne]|uniref:uncharacterized protein n=1 Tax=Lolium perenne TaxID=4522 RepID=UPI003A9965BF
MRALIYNIRGFGEQGRRTQLKSYIRGERVDIIGLQETIKADFSATELRSLEFGGQFAWNWLPAEGHSGGMLLGFRDECFDVGAWRQGTFFISATILQRKNNMKWCFFLVYGPADHRRTDEFLGELTHAVAGCQFPVVIAGDFNLIRTADEKSNDNICWSRVRRFNEAIANMALRELERTGARFTWTNKRLRPTRCVLDRVLVAPAWEAAFPLCSLTAITRIGSDHTPLLLSTGEETRRPPPRFFFQTWWFGVPGFGDLLKAKLGSFIQARGAHRCCIDQWQCVARNTRQFLKGWGANLGKEKRDFRASLLLQVSELDKVADATGLDEDGWALRYYLEDQLAARDRAAEDYWRQRSRVQWTLRGDSCTAYFHAIANGRRRKCSIPRLITDQGEVQEQQGLMEHIYVFYQGLMGSVGETRRFSLGHNLWEGNQRVSQEENHELELTFTADELDEVLASMKQDSAPGLTAYQSSSSNAYAIRLAPVAHRVIDRCQTAFIKGRCLHEGALALHEIVHELHVRKQKGLLLKLDFEKAYDRVDWDFLQEILLRKGFSAMMVHD